MSIPCFVVERVNERTVHKMRENPCDGPDCTSCHRGWDETVFDIRRMDTGEIVATEQPYLGYGLPPGAMYWREMSSKDYPKSAEDFDDWDETRKTIVRDSFANYPKHYPGPSETDPTLPKRSPSHLFADGPQLVVVLPGGHQWNIDSRASNCTMPYDYTHRCWVRDGDPPNVNVDKNGQTCAAGAGSIAIDNWHGFLRHGVLVQ